MNLFSRETLFFKIIFGHPVARLLPFSPLDTVWHCLQVFKAKKGGDAGESGITGLRVEPLQSCGDFLYQSLGFCKKYTLTEG